MNGDEARRFPVDYDAVRKGDTFTVEQLQEFLGGDPQTNLFHLAVLQLKDQMERELARRGKQYSLCIDNGGLRVMTDPEAAEYHPAQFAAGERKMARHHARMLAVDVGQLDGAQRAAYERNVNLEGVVLASVVTAKARVELIPARRPNVLPPRAGGQEGQG